MTSTLRPPQEFSTSRPTSSLHPPSVADTSSNRFTLTDYVDDGDGLEERGSAYTVGQTGDGRTGIVGHPNPLASAGGEGSSGAGRPSSWGLALQSEISQIRGSTILSPTSTAPVLPLPASLPAAPRSEANTMGRSITRPDPGPGNGPVTEYRSRLPPTHNLSLSPGVQVSPSDNEAIRRLPLIPSFAPHPHHPVAPSAASPTASSSASASPPIAIRPLPTLPGIPPLPSAPSSSSLSSQPSPLLPPFQLASPKSKEYQPRPSLATLPSSRSGLHEHRRGGTELEIDVLPSLTWEEVDRDRTVSFAGKDGEGRDLEKAVEGEKAQGLTYRDAKPEREDRRGKWWSWIVPETLYTKLLLATVVTELVIDLIIESNILWRFTLEVNSTDSTPLLLENKRRLPIFLIIFGLAHLWQLVLTVIAIRTKNTIQIAAITIFNFAFLAWAVIQVSELRQILGDLQTSLITEADLGVNGGNKTLLNLPLNVLTAVIIGVVSTGSVILSILAYLVSKEFGWQRYRFLGADLQIRGYYRRFQIFECLAYFTAFFCAGFGIQFLWLVLQRTDAEYIITWVMFPVSLILLVIGRTAAKHENKPFMIFFGFGLILGQGYFIFKLIRIWQQSNSVYLNVTKSLTVFDVLSVLSLTACLIWAVLVYRDFGKGLKGAVLSQYPKSPRVGFNRWRSASDEQVSATAVKRLSID